MAREILLQPRQISISTTLLAKVQTIAIGTADTDAKQDEMFLHKSGHAFVADATGTKLVGTGTGTVDSKLVPIVTPIDILPRFAVPGTLGDGSEILVNTADIRTTVDANGKFKQLSLLQLKNWINASISGDLGNIGLIKIDALDTTYGFIKDKLLGSAVATGNPVSITLTPTAVGNKTITITGGIVFKSTQITSVGTDALARYEIIAINGGTI